MADVFISYAREDLAIAQQLAADLTARGYSVWWDTQLVGSDDFYEVILSALSAAKAAIVIWSKHSVKSRFVRDEARYALFHEKLVAAKTADLDIMDVPFGFQSQHTDGVEAREQLVAGLRKLGVEPNAALGVAGAATPDALINVIAQSSDPEVRRQAALRLMEAAPKAAAAPAPGAPAAKPAEQPVVSREARELTSSNLRAFGQGLLLRVPEFQLERQGLYSSIGVIISLVAICVALIVAAFAIKLYFELPGGRTAAIIIFLAFFLSCLLLYRYARRYFASRNWVAGALLSIFIVALALGVALFLALAIKDDVSLEFGEFLGVAGVIELLAIVAIYLAVRRGRR